MGTINFGDFAGNFFKLEQDKPTTVVLANWKQTMSTFEGQEPRPAVNFEVLSENGVKLNPVKDWTVTSSRLILKLRPLIEKAEAAGVNHISAQITKVGDKKETQYGVVEVAGKTPSPSAPQPNKVDEKIAELQEMVYNGFLTKEGFDTAVTELKKQK